MFSWLTGPRITNVIEDLQPDPNYDTTFVDPPDTPAPQFAVKAFKQALFGTPAQPERSTAKKTENKPDRDAPSGASVTLPPPKENALSASPSKQPGGILMTPGTASKGRKTVSFGAHVVDNEGKRGGIGRSGIPNDCPGKFPSPWTPGTELQKVDATSDSRPRTKLTAALYNARNTAQAGQKPKAKDDTDITIDLGTPRSESGKYWKEQYETYTERSQKEVKKLLKKQQMAKNYAKKKDSEAMEAIARLAEERKQFHGRERQLEQQNKDLQERLRQAMADNAAAGVEIAALKTKIAVLEKSLGTNRSDLQNNKGPFQIFEDLSKDPSTLRLEQPVPEANNSVEQPSMLPGNPAATTSHLFGTSKENSPPKLRHRRRQTVADTSSASMLQTRSPANTLEATNKPALEHRITEPPPKSPLRPRLPQTNKENIPAPPKSPTNIPSSPLPQPSPDPWLQPDSPIPAVDRMALPIASGMGGYSRPSRPTTARHRISKSAAPNVKATSGRVDHNASKSEGVNALSQIEPITTKLETKIAPREMPQSDTARDDKSAASEEKLEKSAQNAVESSTMLKSRAAALSQDRREQAMRRLRERAKAKKMAAGV